MDIFYYKDYREVLKAKLEERVSRNPRYSMRAFAKDLKISPQMLNFVMNRKKGISNEFAADICDRLEFDPQESSYFVDLVTLAHAKSVPAQKLAQFRIKERSAHIENKNFRSLELEAFKAISDWHHIAILELTLTDDFNADPLYISNRLGISVLEVNQAIERLKTLELIEESGANSFKKTDINLAANYGQPTPALRKLARQLLQKAMDSLESQAIEERDITNMTMAIDPARLPEAKKMIASFRRKLCQFLEQGDRKEVYVFAPSLFRISQIKSKKEVSK